MGEFYFWQNMPAMHQVPYQRELVKMGHRVVLCVDQLMLPERAAMGWQPEDMTGLELHVGLSWAEAEQLVVASPPNAIHLISGVRGVNNGGRLTQLAYKSGRRACWISETWDQRGLKGALRTVFFAIESLFYRRWLTKIFAMGEMGVRAYRSLGYAAGQVAEFNYVVSCSPQNCLSKDSNKSFVFGFVGSLVELKGVDVMFRALAEVSRVNDVVVEVHGDGPEKSNLEQLSKQLGFSDRIFWKGRFKSNEAVSRITSLDALVLPSRKDGWGAVVNEALLCGVPVIVSDACGASCIPERHGWGRVFKAGDVQSCAEACRAMLQKTPVVDPVAVDTVIGSRATAQRLLAELAHA